MQFFELQTCICILKLKHGNSFGEQVYLKFPSVVLLLLIIIFFGKLSALPLHKVSGFLPRGWVSTLRTRSGACCQPWVALTRGAMLSAQLSWLWFWPLLLPPSRESVRRLPRSPRFHKTLVAHWDGHSFHLWPLFKRVLVLRLRVYTFCYVHLSAAFVL